MNVKLKIPTNLEDITVGQFQAIQKLLENEDLKGNELDDEILKVVLKYDNIKGISAKDRNMLVNDIRNALEEEGTFYNRFTLKGIEFGLIPNFDKLSNGEYTDIIKYSDNIQELHRFLAVTYRPIKIKDSFQNYKIVEYNGTSEHAENMRELPMSIANGVQFFFYSLSKDSKKHILMSMEQEQVRG